MLSGSVEDYKGQQGPGDNCTAKPDNEAKQEKRWRF